MSEEMVTVNMIVNGENVTKTIPVRTHLVDFIRTELGFTGSHLGCEHGVCGACTVLIDGKPMRSCLSVAANLTGCRIETVEGFRDGIVLSAVQRAIADHGAVQCGFCTPGMVSALTSLLREQKNPTVEDVREAISGHLCRCTGYVKIVEAALATAANLSAESEKMGDHA